MKSGFFLSVISPNDIPATENFLNSMILQVSVPVLSEKIYSIYPNSSFRLEDYTAQGVSHFLFFSS